MDKDRETKDEANSNTEPKPTLSSLLVQKYGLKPMSEVLEQHTKITEHTDNKNVGPADQTPPSPLELLKKHSSAPSLKERLRREVEEVKKEEENKFPQIYQYLEDTPDYRPSINIGEKWARAITHKIKSETELDSSMRKGTGYIFQALKKGKGGIDTYILMFSLIGAALIPAYVYYRNKQYYSFIKEERGLKDGEELDVENGKFDIDEISVHRNFLSELQEENVENYKKLKRKRLINELEKDTYTKE